MCSYHFSTGSKTAVLLLPFFIRHRFFTDLFYNASRKLAARQAMGHHDDCKSDFGEHFLLAFLAEKQERGKAYLSQELEDKK